MIMYVNILESDADKIAFQKFYEENNRLFFNLARRILHNTEDAEDAVQTCFLKIAEKYDRYCHQSKENMVRLGCTVVKHIAIDIVREKKMTMAFTNESFSWEDKVLDEAPDILDQLIEKTDRGLITQAIMRLSEDERNYLYLRYVLNLKPKEMGELFDMKASAVRKKLYQCRSKLAVILEGDEYECLR